MARMDARSPLTKKAKRSPSSSVLSSSQIAQDNNTDRKDNMDVQVRSKVEVDVAPGEESSENTAAIPSLRDAMSPYKGPKLAWKKHYKKIHKNLSPSDKVSIPAESSSTSTKENTNAQNEQQNKPIPSRDMVTNEKPESSVNNHAITKNLLPSSLSKREQQPPFSITSQKTSSSFFSTSSIPINTTITSSRHTPLKYSTVEKTTTSSMSSILPLTTHGEKIAVCDVNKENQNSINIISGINKNITNVQSVNKEKGPNTIGEISKNPSQVPTNQRKRKVMSPLSEKTQPRSLCTAKEDTMGSEVCKALFSSPREQKLAKRIAIRKVPSSKSSNIPRYPTQIRPAMKFVF